METALRQLVIRVAKALDHQDIALGIFLFIEGAFDNTSCDSMCSALTRHGVDQTVVRWIRATLEDRLATTAFGGVSRGVVVSRSCHQGDLSPLLLCLVVSELLVRLNVWSVYPQG